MKTEKPSPENTSSAKKDEKTAVIEANEKSLPEEKNGFKALGLPEPTRYGDWDVKGRCSDF